MMVFRLKICGIIKDDLIVTEEFQDDFFFSLHPGFSC